MRTKAKKSLGQNFLKDQKVIDQIVAVAEVSAEDRVLEIGPGTGALTAALAPRVKQLVAVELDRELVKRLQQHFSASQSVSILEGNILDLHTDELLSSLGYENKAYKVIANIPYYITAPIIRMLLSLACQPRSMTLMVQNEVADRLAAQPGDMSLLSVMAQYYARVEKKFVVPKDAFDPVPQVDSAVVQLFPSRPFAADDDKRFFRIVRAGFAARRKTLVNNLASSFHEPKETYADLLKNVGIREDVRAQALSLSQWQKIAEAEDALRTRPGKAAGRSR